MLQNSLTNEENMKHLCDQPGYNGIFVINVPYAKLMTRKFFVILFDAYRVDRKYFGELYCILSIYLAKI